MESDSLVSSLIHKKRLAQITLKTYPNLWGKLSAASSATTRREANLRGGVGTEMYAIGVCASNASAHIPSPLSGWVSDNSRLLDKTVDGGAEGGGKLRLGLADVIDRQTEGRGTAICGSLWETALDS